MARKKTISDETLQQYLDNGFSQAQIAELCQVSEAAISKRVHQLRVKESAKSDIQAVQQARLSVWQVREKLEWLQSETEKVLSSAYEPVEKLMAINALTGQLRFALSSLSTLYSIEEQAAFQEEVLTILGEIAPDAREKVLRRLKEKRPLRAALLESGRTIPD